MKVYVTFGQKHAHSLGGRTFDKDCVAVIDCADYAEGRAKAFELFDAKFAFCYPDFDSVDMNYYPGGLLSPLKTNEAKQCTA